VSVMALPQMSPLLLKPAEIPAVFARLRPSRQDSAVRSAITVTDLTAISLFSGAGGLDLGAELAGFATRAAVESSDIARATMLANAARHFPELQTEAVLTDVLGAQPTDLLERADVGSGEVDLLIGGPPCTPFSKSGYWLEYKRAGEDPKASLLDEYVRLLAGTQPRAFVMENVYGLAYRNQNRPVLNRFLLGARAAGYAVDYRILLAADYGVPQLRQRMFCVGIRADLLDIPPDFWRLPWPDPTHSGPHETRTGWDESLAPHVTAAQAFMDLADNPVESEEVVDGTYAEELRAVPPGENYLFWTAERGHPAPRFKWRSRYWSFLLKLAPDRPSPTIQGQPGPWVGPFHWESRRLRVAELKRLMAFPDDFVVLGSRREQQLQLGNAVPPPLGAVVIGAVRDELGRLGVAPALMLAA
jgi:DNA (cytosine-5)-methyltransferase 1